MIYMYHTVALGAKCSCPIKATPPLSFGGLDFTVWTSGAIKLQPPNLEERRETRKTGLDLFSVCPSFVVWSGVATSPLKPFSPTWISFRWFGFGWSGRGQLRPPRIKASNRSLETKEGAEPPRWCENSESAVQSLWKALEEVLGRPSDGSARRSPRRCLVLGADAGWASSGLSKPLFL